MSKVEVDTSDLYKLHDALGHAAAFHEHRDRMNATLHLANEPRFSPLTSEVMAARERVEAIIESDGFTEAISGG